MLHTPVLLNEVINLLNIKKNGTYVDCTAGRGGHSEAILAKLSNNGKLICLDMDEEAIKFLNEKFKKYKNVLIVKENFKNLWKVLQTLKIGKVDGILADLGVSSPMFDDIKRGFSYHNDALLDMRMDQTQALDAKYVINNYSKSELIRVFKNYGEAKDCNKVANKILEVRKQHSIVSTRELVEIIKSCTNSYKTEKHPAKVYFQALRIEVNGELDNLKQLLSSLDNLLSKNGVCLIITFHSLEDRIVKEFFSNLTSSSLPKEIPLNVKPNYGLLVKKPVIASQKELEINKRAHSAKLRGVIKYV